MSASSDILRLFTELALAARRPNTGARHNGGDGDDEAAAAATAAASLHSLVASLKPNTDAFSGSRVLDAALSLMCFRSPEVYGSTIDCIVKTIASVLSSSVSCKVDRLGERGKKEEGILRVGSSIRSADREKLLSLCVDVLGSLKGHGLCQPLVHAALKVAVSAPDCQTLYPMSRMYYERSDVSRESRSSVILKLESLLPVESTVNDCEVPLRLLLWYLDPLLLKDDISNMLRETVRRPFLCLENEFHERMAWRVIIICLVTSPALFKQTRVLLHKWFLVTGLTSVLELQIAIVSSLFNVLSRPMWWGLSMELGLKLPFSYAYFPTCHSELVASLTGSISCESFLNLVSLLQMPLAPTGNNMNPIASPPSHDVSHWNISDLTRIDYNSTWALLMNFPAWFYFATVLIFFGENSQGISLTYFRSRAVEAETKTAGVVELRHAASRYLAFVLSPLDEDSFNFCFNLVNEMSSSWGMKIISDPTCRCLSLETGVKNACRCGKKLRKPNVPDTQQSHITLGGHEGAYTEIWLREFHKYCEKFRLVSGHALCQGRTTEIVHTRSSLLFTRISLGILVCCISSLDERECELLLNYAATGEITQIEDQTVKNKEPIKKRLGASGHEYPSFSSHSGGSEWAFKGATLVFNVFDCIEEICSTFCGSEDEMLDFICLMKGKTGNYLLCCVREVLLLYVPHDDDGGRDVMLKDLSMRLIRWQKQGREIFEGCASFSDILDDLNRR